MRKVIIVGAGISGLSAGVYAAKSGFDVTIYEQHLTFGGLSTGWSRKGYFFEGGMHWLTGSSEKLELNRIWKETGALKKNNPIEIRDPFYIVIHGNKTLRLWRDLDKLCEELLAYSPEDKKAIERLRKDVKAFMHVHLVVVDIPGVKTDNPCKPPLSEYTNMLPALSKLRRLSKTSYEDYVNQFKNEDIKSLLRSLIGYRYNALSMVYTLASFAIGDCGYPHGGSILLAQNMLDTYKALGGKIEFRKPVQKVVVENGRATGVQLKDSFEAADAVIVTQDTRAAFENLFDVPITDSWTKKLVNRCIGEQNIFISLGIKADLSDLPYSMIFPLEKPIEFAGCKWTELRVNNYAKYKDHAPEGGTSMTCLLIGDCYDFWKAAKQDGTYKQKKDEIGKLFVQELSKFIPRVGENLEVIDVATPLTYERYCSSYKGSWMTVWTPHDAQYNYPQKLKCIKGVYFAGQRILMPGGLPIALFSGRQAVQHLCKDTKTMFVGGTK